MTRTVGQRLRQFKRPDDDVNELIIIAYGGQGECKPPPDVDAPDRRLHLIAGESGSESSSDSEEDHFVDWNDVQSMYLFPCYKDTLVILDCCFAGAADRSTFAARKDVLAACPWDDTTPRARASTSFTKHTIRALQSFSVPFTVWEMLNRIKSYGPSKTPVYFWRPDYPSHEIILTPLTRPASSSGGGSSTAVSAAGPSAGEGREPNQDRVFMFEIVIRLGPLGSFSITVQIKTGSAGQTRESSSIANAQPDESITCNSKKTVPD